MVGERRKKETEGNKSFTRVSFSKKEGRKGEKRLKIYFQYLKKENRMRVSGHFLGF